MDIENSNKITQTSLIEKELNDLNKELKEKIEELENL